VIHEWTVCGVMVSRLLSLWALRLPRQPQGGRVKQLPGLGV